MNDAETKRKIANRLRRVEGQISALRRMIDEDSYCVDVLVQLAAAQGALNRVGEIVLGSHIRHCVTHAFTHGNARDREQKVDELMDVFARYSRIGPK